jgi:rhamnulokinase
MKYSLAIDIGASSGRHIVGYKTENGIMTDEIYRFPNGMDTLDGHLVWDIDRLFSEIKEGIKLAIKKYPTLSTVAIDTWGVDYVLLRGDTEVRPAFAYRDARMEESIPEVHKIIPFDELYSMTGIQFNKFNTVYQLYSDKMMGRLSGVTDFLMLPEYFSYKLTGNKVKEFTEGTTGALVDVDTLQLKPEIFERLGLPTSLIAPLNQPGTSAGFFKPEIAEELGGSLEVILCASHDTASAVEAIEMESNAPYISSGTWSLLGVKTEKAITDEKSRLSDYSNEGGVGYNRYQKNITGMWIIQSLRKEMCPDKSYPDIADEAAESTYAETFDVNDDSFMAPESMKTAVYNYLKAAGKPTPENECDYFNAAYHSLALGYKKAIDDLENNTGKTYPGIYIVGGGAKNAYLNALTEKYTGKKVYALPIEATAIGNLKIQLG